MSKMKLAVCASSLALAAASSAHAGSLWIANITQASENPPTGVPFTGVGTVILNDTETVAIVRASNNIPPPLSAGHIHRAPIGVNGPVIFPFPDPVGNTVGPLTWNLSAADVASLKTLGLYFNFHTPAFPIGVIRGQIQRFSFAPAATDPSMAAVAAALDVAPSRNADLDAVILALAVSSTAVQTQGLNDLSGRTLYAQGREAVETMADFEDSLFSHAEEQATGRAEGIGGFLQAGDAFGKRDTVAGQAGSKVSRPSILGGVDYGMSSGSRVGLAVGYAKGKDKFRNGAGKTDSATTAVQGYFSSGGDSFVFTAVGGYGWSSFDTTRNLGAVGRVATSSHDGKVWSLGAKISAPMAFSDNMTVAPYGLVDIQHASVEAYTETGAGAAGLVVPKHKDQTAAVEAGAALVIPMGGEAGAATARLQAGWRYRIDDDDDSIATAFIGSPTPFDTPVLTSGKSAAHIAASINARLGENLTASAGYRGLIAKRANVHTVEVRLSLRM